MILDGVQTALWLTTVAVGQSDRKGDLYHLWRPSAIRFFTASASAVQATLSTR